MLTLLALLTLVAVLLQQGAAAGTSSCSAGLGSAARVRPQSLRHHEQVEAVSWASQVSVPDLGPGQRLAKPRAVAAAVTVAVVVVVAMVNALVHLTTSPRHGMVRQAATVHLPRVARSSAVISRVTASTAIPASSGARVQTRAVPSTAPCVPRLLILRRLVRAARRPRSRLQPNLVPIPSCASQLRVSCLPWSSWHWRLQVAFVDRRPPSAPGASLSTARRPLCLRRRTPARRPRPRPLLRRRWCRPVLEPMLLGRRLLPPRRLLSGPLLLGTSRRWARRGRIGLCRLCRPGPPLTRADCPAMQRLWRGRATMERNRLRQSPPQSSRLSERPGRGVRQAQPVCRRPAGWGARGRLTAGPATLALRCWRQPQPP